MRTWQNDLDLVHRRRWLSLVVLCLSLVVIIIDNSILNVALPTLSKSPDRGGLGAADADLQWIVDSYVLIFAGLLLTAGALGDRFGRYRALAGGLLVFGLGSTLAALSTSSGTLIAFRAVMGIGAAFIMPATLSIITNVFRDPQERGRAIGVWAGVSALGLAVGPVTGGFLLEHFWWGSVLLVNLPVVILALVGGWLFIPDSRDPAAPRLDVPGAVLSMAGLATVLWALIEGPTEGWLSGTVLGAFAVGLGLLAVFIAWERHTDEPMLDIGFFRNPRFSAASGAITLTFMALMGMIFMLTQYLQSVLGFSPLKAGAILIPMSAVMMVLAPMSARFVERLGTKVVLGAGLLIVSLALGLESLVTAGTATWVIILMTMLLGAGMANVMAPATESIMGSLPREKAGVGSAVNDTTRQVGGAVGVALLGSLLASRYGSHVESGLGDAGLPAGVLDRIGGNVQAGISAGNETGGALGERIVGVSHDAFLSGMHLSVLVAAGITLLAAAGVFRWLPARATVPADAVVPLEPSDDADVMAVVGNGAGAGADATGDGAPGRDGGVPVRGDGVGMAPEGAVP
ncbi:MAG TPA: MFS transporter [Acidimicrobiales bacterium]|nr:MFS transporter [Acidimicrobiales bacterium]